MPSAPVTLGSEACWDAGQAEQGGEGALVGAQRSVGHLGVTPKLFRMVYGADDALHAAIGLRGLFPN